MIDPLLLFVAAKHQGEYAGVGLRNRFPSLYAVGTRRGVAFPCLLLACVAVDVAGFAAHGGHGAPMVEAPGEGPFPALVRAVGLDGGALPAVSLPVAVAMQCFLGLARLPKAESRALLLLSALALAIVMYVNAVGYEITPYAHYAYGAYASGVAYGVLRALCPRLFHTVWPPAADCASRA